MPFGKHEGFLGKVANGWNLSGVTVAQDGTALTVEERAAEDLRVWRWIEFDSPPLNLLLEWVLAAWQLLAAWKLGWGAGNRWPRLFQ